MAWIQEINFNFLHLNTIMNEAARYYYQIGTIFVFKF